MAKDHSLAVDCGFHEIRSSAAGFVQGSDARTLPIAFTRQRESVIRQTGVKLLRWSQVRNILGGDKAAMRDGRIVIAERFYPSTQIGSCCGWLTGPKGREGLWVERWVCSECSAEHERDARNQPSKVRAG
jgi:hypothetical protein